MKVLITGTSQGIGQATALKFINEGYEVIGIDRLECAIVSNRYTHYIHDITDANNFPVIKDVNILINNAGQQLGYDDIEVNLKGSIYATEEYAIQKNIKSVVFVASASARTGAEFPFYAASKGGVVAYMKNVALRIARFGATSNSISPGGVSNSLNQHILDDKALYKQVLDETMLGKWMSNEEVAEWIYFVAVKNKSMTAQDILVDNGEEGKSNFIW